MKTTSIFLIACLIWLLSAFVSLGASEPQHSVSLSPTNTHYEAHGPDTNPPATTYTTNSDSWTILLSNSSNAPVKLTLKVADNFPSVPDDYNLIWDGVFLGNTMSAETGRTFTFTTPAGPHTLTVVYANAQPSSVQPPSPAGSYYNLWLDMVSGPSGVRACDGSNCPPASIQTAVEISWPSQLDKHYQVQWSPEASGVVWFDLGVPIAGTGLTNSLCDPISGGQLKIYRVLTVD
jgi:hypothetical protein